MHPRSLRRSLLPMILMLLRSCLHPQVRNHCRPQSSLTAIVHHPHPVTAVIRTSSSRFPLHLPLRTTHRRSSRSLQHFRPRMTHPRRCLLPLAVRPHAATMPPPPTTPVIQLQSSTCHVRVIQKLLIYHLHQTMDVAADDI